MPNLRLVSVDARSYARDRRGLAAALAAAAPDVAVVHNGPHFGRWRTLSATIARNAGLVVVGGGRVGGANLILSTLAIDFVSVSDVLFSHNPAKPAGVCVARLRHAGTTFAVAGAGLTPGVAQDVVSLRAALTDVAGLPLVASLLGGAEAIAGSAQVVNGRFVVSGGLEVSSVHAGEGSLVTAELVVPQPAPAS